jgi:hypothetical protein
LLWRRCAGIKSASKALTEPVNIGVVDPSALRF